MEEMEIVTSITELDNNKSCCAMETITNKNESDFTENVLVHYRENEIKDNVCEDNKNNDESNGISLTDENAENMKISTQETNKICISSDDGIGPDKCSKDEETNSCDGSVKSVDTISVKKSNISRKMFNIIDSDSEDENLFTSSIQTNRQDDSESIMSDRSQIFKPATTKTKSKTRLIDTDSEDDVSVNNKSYNDNDNKSSNDSEDDGQSDNNENKRKDEKDNSEKKSIINRFQTLIDSESEEDENVRNDQSIEEITETHQHGDKQKSEKKRKVSARASKDEAMRQIYSESQRLMRETRVSLPYHKPKQHTFEEFFNRKRMCNLIPAAPTIKAKMKMSTEILSKAMEEKIKETELFYKSSDSEDETSTQMPSSNKEENKTENRSDNFIDVSREEKDEEENNSYNKNKNDHDIDNEINNQEGEGLKQKIGNSHVSRKLFDTDYLKDTVIDFDALTSSKGKDNVIEVDNPERSTSEDNTEKINNANNVMEIDGLDQNIVKEVKDIINVLMKSVEHEIDKINKSNSMKNVSIESETTDFVLELDENEVEQEKPTQESQESIPEGHVYGLPLPKDIEDEAPTNIKQRILMQMPNIKPKLKGKPGMTIDLFDDVKPNKKGVDKLLDRFFSKHATKHKVNQEVTIVHLKETEDGPIAVKDVLPQKSVKEDVYVPPIDYENPEVCKPGVKYRILKEDLKSKMMQKRKEEWKHKEREMAEYETEDMEFDDCGKCDIDEDELGDDELSESGESEPEEDDMPIKEKKRSKCAFADDEAEVSECDENEENNYEDDEEEEENDDDEHSNNEKNKNNTNVEDEDDDEIEEEGSDSDHSNQKRPKTLKRIIKPFDDESNNDSNLTDIKESETELNCGKKKVFQRTRTDIDMFDNDGNDAWMSDSENYIPAYQPQPQTNVSQVCKTPSVKTSVLDFISPIMQLTALNTGSEKKDSAKKSQFFFTDEPSCTSIENTPMDKKNEKSIFGEKRVGLQKKLFEDQTEAPNEDELLQLCSGKFTETQQDNSDNFNITQLNVLMKQNDSDKVMQKNLFVPNTPYSNTSESQLMDLCSGSFSTQKTDGAKSKSDIFSENENSQDIKLNMEDSNSSDINKSDEKQKQKNDKFDWSKFRIVSSDEEQEDSDDNEKVGKLKKKKVQKLNFSDDEDETNEQLSDEEKDEVDEEEDEKYVDYDSEENEVVVVPKKDIKKVAAKFLEAEAELSESDWDSADEDEKDLDKLEVEDGDEEDIDEDQMKDQLGKIHMRQVMDEDQRKVRLLKELLFEDGDLHTDGSGRERKFRWKNIDKMGNDDNPQSVEEKDGWLDFQDDEKELQWRKLKHEREKFLENKMKSSDDGGIEEDLSDSQIFKLGMKIFKKGKSNQSQKENVSTSAVKTTEPLIPRSVISNLLHKPALNTKSRAIHNLMQKRSILAKGEESLARIAALAKQNQSVSISSVKTKNFVFTHISPSVKDETETNNKEAEYDKDGKTEINKRKRKATTSGTPKTIKKTKVDGAQGSGKKLFA